MSRLVAILPVRNRGREIRKRKYTFNTFVDCYMGHNTFLQVDLPRGDGATPLYKVLFTSCF